MMQVVKRASMKYPDGHEVQFVLTKREKGDHRWVYAESGAEVSGIAYLSESDAVRAMRISVDHEPELAGVDLTIIAIDPPPEARAARRIVQQYSDEFETAVGLTDSLRFIDEITELIASETNLPALTSAFSDLLAYVYLHRPAFAKALFPVTPQGAPRDLVMDGLLLTAVEAMQKTTGQDFSNLIKPLKEPVSTLMIAKGMPKQRGPIQ